MLTEKAITFIFSIILRSGGYTSLNEFFFYYNSYAKECGKNDKIAYGLLYNSPS